MDQLTIPIEDKLGMLATLLDIIARHKVNVFGLSTERGPLPEIRLLVNEPLVAQEFLENAGLISRVVDVVGITLLDEPGQIAKIFTLLAENEISIEYAYLYHQIEGKRLFAMHTDHDSDTVRKLLGNFEVS